MLRQSILEAMDGRVALAALKDTVDRMAKQPPFGSGPPPVNMAVSRARDRLHEAERIEDVGPQLLDVGPQLLDVGAQLLEDLDQLRDLLESSKPPLR